MWNSGARHLTSRIEEKSFERKARISDKAFHPRLENSYAKEGGASWPCLADDSFQRTGSRRGVSNPDSLIQYANRGFHLIIVAVTSIRQATQSFFYLIDFRILVLWLPFIFLPWTKDLQPLAFPEQRNAWVLFTGSQMGLPSGKDV